MCPSKIQRRLIKYKFYMLLQLFTIGINILEPSCSYYKLYLLQLLQQIFCVRVRGYSSNRPLLVIPHIQLSSFNKDSYDTRNIFLCHCQVKRRPSVHVLSTCVSSECLEQNFGEIGVSLPGSPMKWSHFKLINVKGQIRVGLQKSFCIFLASFYHSKKILTIVVIE